MAEIRTALFPIQVYNIAATQTYFIQTKCYNKKLEIRLFLTCKIKAS
jgi:hypothetical protein